jgi:molybdopterin converting factor small subunit
MSVSVNIHKTHRQYTDGMETVTVAGDTVGTCLKALVERFPQMQDAIFTDAGEINRQIEIYLNMESAYPDELKKKVQPEDEIHITVMLSGG